MEQTIRPPRIYLDHHSTTPVDPRVVEAMLPWFTERFGNPASSHAWGREARAAVEHARRTLATLLGAEPADLVFTSGATEANAMVLMGITLKQGAGCVLVHSAIEHSSVSQMAASLGARGAIRRILPVDGDGRVRMDELRTLAHGATLISVLHAGNEVGVIQDLATIAVEAREKGALFHTDATQSFGKIPWIDQEIPVDYATLSAHKFHGPKGIGVLWLRGPRARRHLAPMMVGGGQEGGWRSGTLPVASIVGCAKAAELAVASLPDMDAVARRRDRLEARLRAEEPDSQVSGGKHRLPNNLHICFKDLRSTDILRNVPTLGLSTGSACSTDEDRSPVLDAIGIPERYRAGALRIGLARTTTDEDIDRAGALLVDAIRKCRGISAH